MILMFLSPLEPPETRPLTLIPITMLAVVSTPRQLARQVGDSVKCDSGSTVVGATRLITRASGTAPNGGVCFPGEFSVVAGTFAPGQVLNFGSLAYIADCYGELHSLHEAASTGSEPVAHPLC